VFNYYLSININIEHDTSLLKTIFNLTLIPMFVFISAYTTKTITWREWRSHLLSAIIIYVTFQTIDMIPFYFSGKLSFSLYFLTPQNGVWFFLAVPIWQAIFLLLPRLCLKNQFNLFILLIFSLCISFLCFTLFSLKSGFWSIIHYFPFFIVAYFLNDKVILCLRKGNILILSIIILFTVITLHFQYGEFSIFKEISIINNKLLNYILSFVLSLLLGLAILYFSLSSNKLESIGKNALGIYLIHPIICFIILSLLKYLNIQLNITLVILLTLITITISLLLSKIPFVHWFLVPVVNFSINKK
ncbi:acyltransferase family protein, partial [Proteus myxofaciens]